MSGNQNLSSLYSEISLRHYSNDCLTEDVVRAQCMKAHQVPPVCNPIYRQSFKEGRTQECFAIFDAISTVSAQEFHVRNLLDFYRTVIELQMAVNKFWSLEISLTPRKQLTEATLKLQKLKALQYYDTDTEMHKLLGEVEVNMLRGDAEEVYMTLLPIWPVGTHPCTTKISKVKRSWKRYRRETVSHDSTRTSSLGILESINLAEARHSENRQKRFRCSFAAWILPRSTTRVSST